MGFFKKILDGFKAENEGSGKSEGHSKELNNQHMLKELMTHFKSMLEYESFGRRMLYPMSFTILMHPDDYQKRLPYLPLVVPEIVASFYSVIESKRRMYPNFEPPANYWYFQFVPCDNGMQLGMDIPAEVEPGKILTIASLTTPDTGDHGNTTVDTNTRVSVKLENSNVNNDVNLNMNALRNLNVFGEGTFTCDFDMALNQDHERIRDNSNIAAASGLAELTYSRDGRNYHYVMKDNLIHISGEDELRRGRAFFIIEGEHGIRNSHVQIRYLPGEKKFQIAAFGPARLNSGRMDVSGGGNVIWYDLANNSSIFIDGLVSVRFIKK